MAQTMESAGVIDSEETMCGLLADGRRIYVEMAAYQCALEDRRENPEFWEHRWARGEFQDPENAPYVYVLGQHGEREYPQVSLEEATANFQRAQRLSHTLYQARWVWEDWQRRCERPVREGRPERAPRH